MIEQHHIGLTYNADAAIKYLNEKLNEGFQIIGHGVYNYGGECIETFTIYKPDKPAVSEATQGELLMTQITTIQRDETKSNQRPMWRCTTATGEKVNIFLNVDDPSKDTFHLFEAAGWGDFLNEIFLYSQAQAEIYVALRKHGQWWNIVAVNPAKESESTVPEEGLHHD